MLGVELERELLAYATARAMWDLNCICDHHSSWQHWILNPLSKARDRNCILMDDSQIHLCWATMGTHLFVCLFVCFVCSWSMWNFLGQGWKLHHRSDKLESLTGWPPGESNMLYYQLLWISILDFFFLSFQSGSCGIWRFLKAESDWSCSCCPMLQPCKTLDMSSTYTTANGNVGSLTHWARAGIKPVVSWLPVRFISAEPWWQVLDHFLNVSFYFIWVNS